MGRGDLVDARGVGASVRQRRKQLGLRQTDLAAAAGVSYRFVLDLEGGKETCQLGKALRVLDMLGLRLRVEADDPLLGGRVQGTVDPLPDEGELEVDLG